MQPDTDRYLDPPRAVQICILYYVLHFHTILLHMVPVHLSQSTLNRTSSCTDVQWSSDTVLVEDLQMAIHAAVVLASFLRYYTKLVCAASSSTYEACLLWLLAYHGCLHDSVRPFCILL